MRSIKELLQLMLDNQESFDKGLCHWVKYMYIDGLISNKEFMLLSSYIDINPPFIYKIYRRHRGYYWKPGNIKPRIDWIKKHIKKNK